MDITFVEANNYWSNKTVTDHPESPPKPDTAGVTK